MNHEGDILMKTVGRTTYKGIIKKSLAVIFSVLFVLFLFNIGSHVNAATDNTNPFQVQDREWSKHVQNSVSQADTNSSSNTFSNKATHGKDSSLPAYAVRFKSSVTLTDIFDCVENYSYTLLGKSELRVFQIYIENVEEFKLTYKGIIEYCHENQEFHTMETAPNDTYYTEQWAIRDINLPKAWDIHKGSSNIKVGVIDTGFCRIAQDFNASTILSGCDISGDGGMVNQDTVGHGTAVTSVIAAKTNNSSGMAGVCWNVTIVPYKVDNEIGSLYNTDIIKAIYMAADAGCDVINMSFGSTVSDTALNDAIQYARKKGCILVAAAGNEGRNVCCYPASYSGVISVGAVDRNNVQSYFSQYNEQIDVVAPGEEIYANNSTSNDDYEEDYFDYVDGTSFASPYVVGVAALVKSIDKSITSDEFNTLLAKTSTDLGSVGYDSYYGWGLLDANQVLKVASGSLIIDNSPLVTDKNTGFLFNKDTGTIMGWTIAPNEVSIPSSIEGVVVKRIATNAFNQCRSLKKLTIPSSVTSIGESAFSFCGLSEVTLSEGLQIIREDAFSNNPSLTAITIPASVTLIGNKSFASNAKLKTINVDPKNNNYKSIDGVLYNKEASILCAYPNAKGVSFAIPDTVKETAPYAFMGCSNLVSIAIPAALETIEEGTFQNCISLKSITTDVNNASYKSIDGVLFSKDSSILITFPNAKTSNYTIPNGVTDIEKEAFYNCINLKSLTVSKSVKSFGQYSLMYCTNLLSVYFEGNAPEVEQYWNYGINRQCQFYKNVDSTGFDTFNGLGEEFLLLTYCNLSLDRMDGNQVEIRKVTLNNKITEPTPPEKSGYLFAGWYTSQDYKFKVIFPYKVDKNVTLYARWEPSYIVTFSSQGGSLVPKQNIACNTTIDEPVRPTKTGYDFKGWYTLASGGSQIIFPYKVTKVVTLYARWTPSMYLVTFKSQGGSSVSSQPLAYGKKIKQPVNPTRAGYLFAGWYKDSSYKQKWNFSTDTIKKSTILYAKWTKFSSLTPTGVKAKAKTYKEIQISWDKVSGASGYRIYRLSSAKGKYTLIAKTTSLSYTNKNLATGTTYYYKVLAYQTVGKVTTASKYSKVVSAKPILLAPSSLKVSKITVKKANLTWSKVSGASGYVLYRATSSKGTYKAIKTTTSNKYVNSGLIKGRTYYYKVISYRVVNGKKVYSKASYIVKIKMK